MRQTGLRVFSIALYTSLLGGFDKPRFRYCEVLLPLLHLVTSLSDSSAGIRR